MRYDSNIPKYPGYVILPDFLTLPQVMAFEAALGDINAGPVEAGTKVWFTVLDKDKLTAILLCVSEWHIEGLPEQPTADTFPFSPRTASHKLIDWLFGLIRDLWVGDGADVIPNA